MDEVVYSYMLKWEEALELRFLQNQARGRDSAVSIATRYGLDGAGIDSRWGGGRDFPHLSRPALEPTQPPLQWVRGLSGSKPAGEWR